MSNRMRKLPFMLRRCPRWWRGPKGAGGEQAHGGEAQLGQGVVEEVSPMTRGPKDVELGVRLEVRLQPVH
jgi:hypothetical protein